MKTRIGVVIHTRLRDALFAPVDQDRLNRLGQVTWTDSPDPIDTDQACRLLADCQIAVGSWGTPFPNAQIMAGCPHLRLWEHAAGTVKHFFGPHLDGRNLIIGSCKTAIADNVAEMVLAQIILGVRRAYEDTAANRGQGHNPHKIRVLYGTTVGIIAASEVGKRVIKLLQPFGCRILLHDPYINPEQAAQLGTTLVPDLIDLCRQSDVISLHTPALPATAKMIGAAQFAAMRDDAIFINSARGMCVDEQALIDQCRKGRLTAYLDVTDPEPAPADSPLRQLPNIILTSHIAGPAGLNMGKQAVDDIEAFLAGRQPLCIVRKEELERIA